MLDVVIMAAGKGTRMKSSMPKVLHRLAGKALVQHVIDTARHLHARHTLVITGHGAEQVEAALHQANPQAGLQFARQMPQLGTGHAVQQTVPLLSDDAVVVVLSGDVPLTQADTLRALVDACAGQHLALLTIAFDDPTGYGRIVRNADGQVQAIVEHKDASDAQRAIREVYSGIMAVPAKLLKPWLARLDNHNAQQEYYLTDVVKFAVADGISVVGHQIADPAQVAGVNSPAQLAELERAFQLRQAQALMNEGVRIIDPARLDVRGSLQCAQDVEIDVNCIFQGQVSLGQGVKIGANCVIANCTIAAGAVIHPFTHIDGEQLGVTVGGCRGAHWQLCGGQKLHPGKRCQGQPLGLLGRRHGGRARQLRRGQHHRQLRRRQQTPHRHRGRCACGQQLRVGRACHHWCGRHGGRWLDHHQEHRARCFERGAGQASEHGPLQAAGQNSEIASGLDRIVRFVLNLAHANLFRQRSKNPIRSIH